MWGAGVGWCMFTSIAHSHTYLHTTGRYTQTAGTDWTNAHKNIITQLTTATKSVITKVAEDLKGFAVTGTTGTSTNYVSTTTTSEQVPSWVRYFFPLNFLFFYPPLLSYFLIDKINLNN